MFNFWCLFGDPANFGGSGPLSFLPTHSDATYRINWAVVAPLIVLGLAGGVWALREINYL